MLGHGRPNPTHYQHSSLHRISYRAGQAVRWGSGRSNSSNGHLGSSRLEHAPIVPEPPQFDLPERQPTPEEVQGIAAGAQLTPEQQRAQQLQLPLTQPVRLQPGTPDPRTLMQKIKAASTWQELEAAVYQNKGLLALQQQQQSLQQQSKQPGQQSDPPTTAETAAAKQPEQQQQQQQQQPQMRRKQRRRDPVPMLSVQTSSILSGGMTSTPDAAAATAVADSAAEGGSAPAAAAAGSRDKPSSSSLPVGVPQQQSTRSEPQQQQQQQQHQPQLNALHVTEAFHKLPDLLVHQQGKLAPAEKQRIAVLIVYLSAAALQHAQKLTLDAQGLATVLLGLSKLGHRDAVLLEELQLAVLLKVGEMSGRDTAMVLMAFASLGVKPNAELMAALQQHIYSTLSLCQNQSLVSMIWALAKLQDSSANRQPGSCLSPGGRRAGNLRQPQPDSKLAGQQADGRTGSVTHVGQAGAGPDSSLAETATTTAAAAATAAAGDDGEVSLRQLVKALMWQCDPQMHHWSGRDIAQAAWGLGKLGARPSAVWKEALLAASESQLTKMNMQDLTNLLAAATLLKLLPKQAWVDTLCRTATVKMWTASPLAVSTLLLGLLHLKQGQQRAVKAANKQQQPQQQQEQQLLGSSSVTEQQLQQQQQQQVQGMEAVASTDTPANPTARELTNLAGQLPMSSLYVQTLDELRLLRAALQWVQRNPRALQRSQVDRLITALAELLPEAPAQQQQQQQQQQLDVGSSQQPQPPQQEQQEQQQQQQQLTNGPVNCKWAAAHRQVLMLLREVVPVWSQDVELITKSLGKGRPGRYFKLKWAQLLRKTGMADGQLSSDGASGSGGSSSTADSGSSQSSSSNSSSDSKGRGGSSSSGGGGAGSRGSGSRGRTASNSSRRSRGSEPS